VGRGCPQGRGVEAKLMRTRTPAETLANGGRSRGRTAVRGEDAADGWGRPVSVPQREGLTSGTRSSVTAQRERGSARSAVVGRARMGRPAGQDPGRPLCKDLFLFLFMQFLFDV
jgi:hypothetical protein